MWCKTYKVIVNEKYIRSIIHGEKSALDTLIELGMDGYRYFPQCDMFLATTRTKRVQILWDGWKDLPTN